MTIRLKERLLEEKLNRFSDGCFSKRLNIAHTFKDIKSKRLYEVRFPLYLEGEKIHVYGDIRDESYVQCDGRLLEVKPDQKMDVTNLPFDDESFSLVVFDPPHLKYAGRSSYMYQSYGVLPDDARTFIRQGFDECWRVLKPNGTLIFKWNTNQIPLHIVLSAIGQKPLFGNRKPGGKRGETYWMVFFKGSEL